MKTLARNITLLVLCMISLMPGQHFHGKNMPAFGGSRHLPSQFLINNHDALGKNLSFPDPAGIVSPGNNSKIKSSEGRYVLIGMFGDTLRVTSAFDAGGHMAFRNTSVKNGDSWEDTHRYSYTYDENGNQLTVLYQYLIENELMDISRTTNTYDNRGNQLTDLYEVLVNNTWVSGSRNTFTYDDNDNLLSGLREVWLNGAWVNTLRTTYGYDINGQAKTVLIESWENNAWQNLSRTGYSYDLTGKLTIALLETWENNSWVNRTRIIRGYDIYGNMLASSYQQWKNGAWENISRSNYNYDNSGRITMQMSENWQNNSWLNVSLTRYTFDGQGNLLSTITELWQNESWVNKTKITSVYDNQNNAQSGTLERWTDNQWVRAVGSIPFYYNNMRDVEELFASSAYARYWYVTGLEDQGIGDIDFNLSQNYPNPFNPSTAINFNLPVAGAVSLEVYSLQGEKISTLVNSELPSGKHIYIFDATNFPSGTYFYRLTTEKGSISKKMLLLK